MVLITEALVRKKSEHNELLIGTLEELSLHQEDIERIEHLQNWCRELKILLLQSNLIGKIENLHKLKKLEYLNLAINNIERVENLEQLESLEKLDLTLNFIGELTSIESLRDNYNLRELILTGNPCCDYPHYREYVIATLPQLATFDCEQVTTTDKLQAQLNLKAYRDVIVQRQAQYVIERDEQKVRFAQQKAELDAKLADIDDDDERVKAFWNSKSEHCPEIRAEIAHYHRKGRQAQDAANRDDATAMNKRRQPQLFAPCGRPYNINQAKLPFHFQDERNEYVLQLEVYKYLDTSQLAVEIEINYVRVRVKGKLFQLALKEEVRISDASVQRSQITGHLMVRVPKLHAKETVPMATKSPNRRECGAPKGDTAQLKGTVDIKNICSPQTLPDDLPDLI